MALAAKDQLDRLERGRANPTTAESTSALPDYFGLPRWLIERVKVIASYQRPRAPPHGKLRHLRRPCRNRQRPVEILATREANFEAHAAAVRRLVRAMKEGSRIPAIAYWRVLTWVYRNRRDPAVLELARELAEIDGREIALLGVGLVKYAETPEEVRVGRALFGLPAR